MGGKVRFAALEAGFLPVLEGNNSLTPFAARSLAITFARFSMKYRIVGKFHIQERVRWIALNSCP